MCATVTLLRFLCVADFRLVRFDFMSVTPEATVDVSLSSFILYFKFLIPIIIKFLLELAVCLFVTETTF